MKKLIDLFKYFAQEKIVVPRWLFFVLAGMAMNPIIMTAVHFLIGN